MIDILIFILVFMCVSKFVEVYIVINFLFSLKIGFNVSLWWNFIDGLLVI